MQATNVFSNRRRGGGGGQESIPAVLTCVHVDSADEEAARVRYKQRGARHGQTSGPSESRRVTGPIREASATSATEHGHGPWMHNERERERVR